MIGKPSKAFVECPRCKTHLEFKANTTPNALACRQCKAVVLWKTVDEKQKEEKKKKKREEQERKGLLSNLP